MASSFDKVVNQMLNSENLGIKDHSQLLRTLDPKQRKALELFKTSETITSRQIGDLFGFKPRSNSALCKKWVESGFLTVVDPSNKARKYGLNKKYLGLLD